MEKRALNIAEIISKLKASELHALKGGVKAIDSAIDDVKFATKPALDKADEVAKATVNSAEAVEARLKEQIFDSGTSSILDVPIAGIRSIPGVKKYWTDEKHKDLLYSYQKPLLNKDQELGEKVVKKAPFLKGLFTENDMKPLVKLETKDGDVVDAMVPVATTRLSAPVDKFKRVGMPLLAVLGVNQVAQMFKGEKKDEEKQASVLTEAYRQELIDKIAGKVVNLSGQTLTPNHLKRTFSGMRRGRDAVTGIEVPLTELQGTVGHKGQLVTSRPAFSTPTKRDIKDHANVGLTSKKMLLDGASKESRRSPQERMGLRVEMGKVEQEKESLTSRIEAVNQVNKYRMKKKAEYEDFLHGFFKEALLKTVETSPILRKPVIRAEIAENSPAVKNPAPVVTNRVQAKPSKDQVAANMLQKLEALPEKTPELEKFIAAKKKEVKPTKPASGTFKVKKPAVAKPVTTKIAMEVVALEQDKMLQASSMLKAAAEKIRELQHEITKIGEDNKKLTLQIIAKERSGRAVKLAKDMVAKGLIKRAEYDDQIDRIMDMDDSGFEILQKTVQNANIRKEASTGALDSLAGLYGPPEDGAQEKTTLRDALIGLR